MGGYFSSPGPKEPVDYDSVPHIINSEGKRLYCRYWNDESKTGENENSKKEEKYRALVFICHGAGEHCHYYTKFAEPLMKEGCYVFSHDHVGHGRSEGERMFIEKFDTYSQDVYQHITMIKNKYPDTPMFMIGHSMGGAVTLYTAISYPDLLDGLVTIGSAVTPKSDAVGPIRITLGRWMASLCPRFPAIHLNSDDMSRDPAVIEMYDNDPLVYHGWLSCGWGMALLNAMMTINENFHKITKPILVMHGEMDSICHVSGSKLLYEKVASSDKSLLLYPDCYHQIHSEPDGVGEKVVASVVSWVAARM